MNSPDRSSDERKARSRGPRRALKWGLVLVLTGAACAGGWRYYTYSAHHPSTSDAYVRADVVRVTPRVSGRIEDVMVEDQQPVTRGALLFTIDPRPFRYRLDQAEAALALARQTVAAEQAAVDAARAAVHDSEAKLRDARRQFRRVQNLAARHAASGASLDDARATRDTARAAYALAQAKLRQARVALGEPGEQNQRVREAQAARDQARLDLAHTRVHAPCSGRLSGVSMRPGDYARAGDAQFALVCDVRFWVYANFKETDLTRIRPGQVATVHVDMYPQHDFHGVVESVDPASGTAFSLLPPENASGNWVKVTQRVPVRILVVDAGAHRPLRVRTSAEVSVDTGPGPVPVGRARGTTVDDAAAIRIAAAQGIAVQVSPAAATRDRSGAGSL